MNRRRFVLLWKFATCSAVLGLGGLVLGPSSGCSARQVTGPGVVDVDAPEEFTTTDSGLKYRIRRRGDGDRPLPTDKVAVQYRGWTIDEETGIEKTFDQSYNRPQASEFRVKGVVPGFGEGLMLVREGGMIELIIPPELGYGAEGNSMIPPNATLHFRVELERIVR
ncbi:MAG: FKBP-type peptidyl-prolyl cis-trans isomerase [Planctomycetota bacterium]